MSGIGTEAAVFLYAGLSGMTVFFAYRILGCIRKILPYSSAAVRTEDILSVSYTQLTQTTEA